MKKLIACLAILLTILFVACNNHPAQTNEAAPKTDSMKELYEKNLADLKTGIAAFENKQMDAWAATIADSAVWNPPAYGAVPAKKADWKNALSDYTTNWDSIKLVNAVFLPGVDSATQQFDGSVRYYGQWTGVHKSGVRTSINFYGTYDFNKDNKCINGSDYFDVSGLMNAVKPKAK